MKTVSRAQAATGLVLAIVLGLMFPATGWVAAPGLEVDARRDAAVEAVARVMPSVVNIGTETIVAVRDPFEELLQEFWGPYYRGRPPETRLYSLGSGVIIDESGYVLTNDHVVRRASRVWVKLAEEAGGDECQATLIAGSSRGDVALLKINLKPGQKLKAVRFAADDDLLLGETVLALGNPFGLGGSVSRGILSSKSRRPPVENAPMDIADWLQTDAAVNPGNSGGPLINLRGELIGINVAVYREAQGIGFAIPIKRVSEALADIFSPELKQWWFGARVKPAGHRLSVAAVEHGSPAERAGIKAGDLVVTINGKAPRGFIEFIQELMAGEDKRDTALVVQRGDTRQNLTVRLARVAAVFNASLVKQKLGLSLQEISVELAQRLGLATTDGLLVAGVERNSPAEEVGMERGHVILAIAGQPVAEVAAAAKTLYGKKKGDRVSLQVLAQRRQGPLLRTQRVNVEVVVR
jgi:S1-C subfamily serine protease